MKERSPTWHCAPARDSPEGHYAWPFPKAAAAPAQRPFARARLCCPRRHRSYGLSRQSAPLPATSRSAVIRRVFAMRSGLGWDADLPRVEHRSLPWCRRPYAGEPCGCTCPVTSPQTLAFAHATEARRSQDSTAGLEHSPTKRELSVDAFTTLQRSLDATAPRLARPLSQPTSTDTAGPSGTCTSDSTRCHPPGVPDMTTWAHRTTPRAGLSPAGSMLLRADRREMRKTRRLQGAEPVKPDETLGVGI